ncbi:MAG: ATP-binding protein, partial [Candidatus Binataceae bacterium]
MSEARDRTVPVKDTPPAPSLGRAVVRKPPRHGPPPPRDGALTGAVPHGPAGKIESSTPVQSPVGATKAFAADDLSLLKRILADMGAAVQVLDRNGAAVFMNREARELFGDCGEPSERAPIKAPVILCGADGVTPLEPRELPIMRALGGEHVDNAEMCIRHSVSGACQWLSANTRPIAGPDGQILGAVAVFTRIDSRREREQALKNARDAALIVAGAKSDFAANMSHEIRTPLSAIVGMTRLLLDTSLSAEQRELAETVGQSVDSLISIVNDVLDYSKIAAGKLALESVEFSPIGVLENVVATFAADAHAKGIEIGSSVRGDVPTSMFGDPARLRQVLLNLVGNAVKFTEHGGVIVQLCADDTVGSQIILRFTVRDSGIGISPAEQSHLFQPFSQAATSTTRMYGGTGLGLAICSRLVALMAGAFGVKSAPGEGSSFWFTVPFGIADGASTLADVAVAELSDLRVLIADDSELLAPELCHQLT